MEARILYVLIDHFAFFFGRFSFPLSCSFEESLNWKLWHGGDKNHKRKLFF